ncbi:hypothetical protein NE237_005928 [Protea cynaroides]|uniref:Uncharacterized protein n=1 Tax=Protea cynaroides TaxID=273540 RepID=A0A9Q0KLM3_9MAGN|nr:hypothetical protein NE237_005928 [Protea cynaroides]
MSAPVDQSLMEDILQLSPVQEGVEVLGQALTGFCPSNLASGERFPLDEMMEEGISIPGEVVVVVGVEVENVAVGCPFQTVTAEYLLQTVVAVGFRRGSDRGRGRDNIRGHGGGRDRFGARGFDAGRGGRMSFGSGRGGGRTREGGNSRGELNGIALPKQDFGDFVPFEKSFYVESPSVRSMTEDEVALYRARREITVDGYDVPKPIRRRTVRRTASR